MFSKSIARRLFQEKREGRDVLTPTSFEIRSGRAKQVPEVVEAVNNFSSQRSKLYVAELANTPVKKLFEWLKPRIDSATSSPVVCLDYLQILPSDKDSKREGLDDTLRSLKDFQRSTEATFIVISSFNRQSYWQPVSFESFKESGGIEYSADAVIGIEAFPEGLDEDTEPSERRKKIVAESRKAERRIKLSCLKNRNGSSFDVLFQYFAAHDCFVPIVDTEEIPERKVMGRK